MKTTFALLLCIISLLVMAADPGPASALDLIVEHDPSGAYHYASVQDAIAFISTQTGTTTLFKIIVEPSSDPYVGTITLNGLTNLPIEGRETARTILQGTGTGTLITVSNSTNVSLRKFTIKNVSIGISIAGSSNVTISNNIFQVGTTSTAVNVQTSTAFIENNTFYQNLIAVARDADSGSIKNNIFYNTANTAQINQGGTIGVTTINNNIFFPAVNGVSGQNAIPNSTITDPDPRFVKPADGDFHIAYNSPTPSPAIDQGDPGITDVTDNTQSDIGAYGGPNADSIPFPVTVSPITAAPTSVTVSWQANTSYLIADPAKPGEYHIYYHLNTGSTITVPILASDPTTTVISGLTGASDPPAAPTMNTPGYGDGMLILSWSPVSDATGYNVHYLDSVTNVESTVNVGNTVVYVLAGLVNDREYGITVSAYKQAVYYFTVTAVDNKAHESDLSPEQAVTIGSAVEGLRSGPTQTAFPERIAPNPDLPNTGCFIATAAYGSYSAPEVRLLRRFRDAYLMTNPPGRAFVSWYYRNGPVAADFVNAHAWLKPAVRLALMPALAGAYFLMDTAVPVRIAVMLAAGLLLLALLRKYGRCTGGTC